MQMKGGMLRCGDGARADLVDYHQTLPVLEFFFFFLTVSISPYTAYFTLYIRFLLSVFSFNSLYVLELIGVIAERSSGFQDGVISN